MFNCYTAVPCYVLLRPATSFYVLLCLVNKMDEWDEGVVVAEADEEDLKAHFPQMVVAITIQEEIEVVSEAEGVAEDLAGQIAVNSMEMMMESVKTGLEEEAEEEEAAEEVVSDKGAKGGFGGGYRGKDEEIFSYGGDNDPEKKDASDGDRPKVTYVPPTLPDDEASIFSHYESGINFDKYDDIMVDVSGTNPPQAIMTFDEAALCESLRKNVNKSGYVKPTPVQKHGIPIISAGRDLMACAQTGSGKTAAFLLPILQQLMADGVAASSFSELQEPEAIIVAPTRELINQIYLEARKFAFGTCVRPVVVYGGVSTGHQIRDILRGCNVLCGTPGRLLDMIGRGKTLMFSATYPEDIQRMAADFLKTDYLFLAVGVVGGACSDVEQTFIQVTKFSKREQLLDFLKTTGTERTMVFVETKRQADFIATYLCQEKVLTTSIHGDREQREREQALADFRSGKCPVLVATSVAARGLDIQDVQHVVNFDLPNNIDEYVHRIGRTGRCGNTGKAVSFYDPEADGQLARSLVTILSKAQQEVPSWLEESAFSGPGATGFNPSRKGFASTDSRKVTGLTILEDLSKTTAQGASPLLRLQLMMKNGNRGNNRAAHSIGLSYFSL
ncbi:hypothetical protein FQN60_006952 [Etheostoma spectabile]|uniref:RNA helicase n=1 Tax=Etheostoma spectabile TaxID=54343 RepID=A0A5J5CHB7_9PERO|nr:hypothetical protein FQN60_006952 [Etheostoma spectabile]